MTTMDYLNGCSADAFVAEIGFAFEDSPWIARAAAGGCPFADRAALHAAMVAVVDAAGDDAKVALIRAHPDLAGRVAPRRPADRGLGRREQAGAGLGTLTPRGDRAVRCG